MDEETKTNETGKPLEPFVHVKLVDDNGNLVEENEVLANLHATSPAAADRYLNNPEATAERWYVDENGIKWGVTGDIAMRHADGSYTIMGRASDSYVDENGKRVYLFMIESTLDENDPINEKNSRHSGEHSSGTAMIVGLSLRRNQVSGQKPGL